MKLTSLAIIAAGLIAADSLELAPGSTFEADPAIADKLIADGLAKEAEPDPVQASPKTPRKVKARLLRDCMYGQADEVVSLPSAEAKHAQANGFVDTDPAAVAYAESLVA